MRFTLLLPILLAMPFACRAASADGEHEYAEVRKIALKDPKVQDAFHKAEERLDAKILEIDPSLKAEVDAHSRVAAPEPPAAARPAARPAPSVAETTGSGRHYVVVKGDTLSSIAAHYKVKVAALQKANHIADARDLKIGQRLVIPEAGLDETAPAAPAAETPAAATPAPSASPAGGNLLDRIKSDL
jgi:LysM repeat protein